jgi:glutamate racemase
LQDEGIDTLLLGCTHYPFLARTISDVMGRGVVLVDSADETAFSVVTLLDESDLRRPDRDTVASHRWFSSGDVEWFRRLGARMLGPELDTVEVVAWD